MPNTNQDQPPKQLRWLSTAVASALADVIEFTAGERPEVSEDQAAAGPPLVAEWWEQELDISDETLLWIGFTDDALREAGGRCLKAAEVENPDEQEIRSTWQELLRQTASSVAQQIGAQLGREVCCAEDRGREQAPGAPTIPLTVSFNDGATAGLLVAASPALAAALASTGTGSPKELNAGDTSDHQPARSGDAPTEGFDRPPQTLDLLLDVELPVSVSFGRAYLPLKDVLKLTSGSIVELNRSVAEPVEVIVNNCVIARGQVVVVDGNYGVRINEIISRQERLRTLN